MVIVFGQRFESAQVHKKLLISGSFFILSKSAVEKYVNFIASFQTNSFGGTRYCNNAIRLSFPL